MSSFLQRIALILMLVALVYPSPIAVTWATKERSTGLGLLVKLVGEWEPNQAYDYLNDQGLQVLDVIPQIGVWHVESRSEPEARLMANLQTQAAVGWVEANGILRIAEVTPDDNFYPAQQDNLRLIELPSAWEITTGDDTLVAVVDTGIDLDHPDLEAKVWSNLGEIPGNSTDDDGNGFVDDIQGWDFVQNDNLPQDDQGHGSHVSGIAAAHSDNQIGIAGVSWGARIMALKALDQNGYGDWMDISQAIVYAADHGAQVINLSIGSEDSSFSVEEAINYARSSGCLVVAAAGNGGGDVLFPARLPTVLAVAATDDQDLPWSISNRGPEVDLAAPGVDIFSTNSTGSYVVLSGTSMSTAHVSGLAALVWSREDGLSADRVAEVITETAKDVWSSGFDYLTGWGRIDAFASVSRVGLQQIYLPAIRKDPPKSPNLVFIPAIYRVNGVPE